MEKNYVLTGLLGLVLLFLTPTASAHSNAEGVQIEFTVYWEDPSSDMPGYPKSPIDPPQATLDGHVLTFTTSHADFVLTLLDEDGDEAYTVFVPAATTTVVLPSTLTGLFELQLYPGGSYYFSGDIVL